MNNKKGTCKKKTIKISSEETYKQLLKKCRIQLMISSNTSSDDKIELLNELDKILGKNIQRFP